MISHSLRAVNVQCDYGNGVVVDTANPDSEYGATLFPVAAPPTRVAAAITFVRGRRCATGSASRLC